MLKKFHNGQYCCLSRPSIVKFHRSRPIRGCTRFFELNKKIDFALGIRPADPGDQMPYDARKRTFFGSVLRGLAAERFETLPAETLTAGNTSQTWAQISDAFVNRFSDNRDQYRKRIEIENIKRQPNELITSYIQRVNTVVEKRWPNPSQMNKEQQKMEFFVRGLATPSLEQKAHQRQIEHPGDTWQDLQDYVINRDLSYTVSSEYACAGSPNFDKQSEIQTLKNKITELKNLMKENKINATYDPNQPRNRQNHTRFCNYCKRSGHTIAYCFEKKRHDEQNRQPPSYRDKFTDSYRRSRSVEYNRQTTPQQNFRRRTRDFFQSNNKNNDYNNSTKFTTTLLAHHRIIQCNDIPIHIIKIVLHKKQTRDRVLEV